MKTVFNSTFKPKIRTKRNGNISYTGSFVDGVLYLSREKLLDTPERILTIELYPRYILFGETIMKCEIKKEDEK